MSAPDVFEELSVEDIGRAADLLKKTYEDSSGTDGFVSIEVSPMLARNSEATVEEAKRLFRKLCRENVMIKIPATPEGISAGRELLEDGISVNFTLLFSVSSYERVARAYIGALEVRRGKGLPIDRVSSVASFFVSRVDTAIDPMLQRIIGEGSSKSVLANRLLGRCAVANSRLAYLSFLSIFQSEDFSHLKSFGAAVQRPLWASTGTKNPAYSDVLYVEELIGPDTVNTVPHQTLSAFIDHGLIAQTVQKDSVEAKGFISDLEELGIDFHQATEDLLLDGLGKFEHSYKTLIAAVGATIG